MDGESVEYVFVGCASKIALHFPSLRRLDHRLYGSHFETGFDGRCTVRTKVHVCTCTYIHSYVARTISQVYATFYLYLPNTYLHPSPCQHSSMDPKQTLWRLEH
jgi:hypothetical protein